jgi:hypothetical protein
MKKIIALAALSISTFATSQELVPLDEWDKTTKNWSSQPSEVAYMLGRCGSAFMAMSSYLKANANGEKKIERDATVLMGKSKSFIELSIDVGQTIGATEKFLMDRTESLVKVYIGDIVNNKKLHNNAFGKNFQTDINFCTAYYPLLFNSDGTTRKSK